MNITETRDGESITLSIEGRVDATTSAQLQNAILVAFQKVRNLVLDFGQCEYVSSAGLRALLIGQKTAQSKGGQMKLINVGESFMAVLKLSGFDSIITIE
ncbi:MAG: STAS domain-containing protein [Lachnospiraceae bacterium]|nr:STAS domain-containing protein [Lachnospiraceae bacterium]MBR5368407.1 STAS domain-containing protein [Lachnospiraceae bacterium]